MFNLKLAAEGWSNLKKISKEGLNGLVDVFTPSGGDIINQVKAANTGPAPVIVDEAKKLPEVIPEVIPDTWKKYAKYAAVAGVGLVAYSVLKK